MTPGEPTEQLPRVSGVNTAATSGKAPDAPPATVAAPGAPRIPLRPEDVDRARAEAKSAKAAAQATGAQATAGTSTPRPAATAKSAASRRVHLSISRIDPWSAMKISFLLSVALGIALVVATATLWIILAGMGAFDQVNNVVGQIIQDGNKKFDIMDFVGFGRVVALSIVVAVIDVVLWTALATLGAFIYNVSSSLVGGLHLTLTDD